MNYYLPITHSTERLEIVQYPLYRLKAKEIKGLENTLFTQSKGPTSYGDVLGVPSPEIDFSEQNAILQSAQEAVAFTACAGDVEKLDYSDCMQLTRTTALLFYENRRYFISFDDIPDINKNLSLKVALSYFRDLKEYRSRNPERDYRGNVKPRLSLSLINQNVLEAIKRAEDSNRLIELPQKPIIMGNIMMEFQSRNIKDISRNPFIEAIWGRMSRLYALHIKDKYTHLKNGIFCLEFPSKKWVDRIYKDLKLEEEALIMTVIVGKRKDRRADLFLEWPGCTSRYGNEEFGYARGYARGVKNSPGFLS